MNISDSLLPEFDQEMANTRKTLERVPDEKFDWRPHAKSGTMGWLAHHLAVLPIWGVSTITTRQFDLAPPEGQTFRLPTAGNRKEILDLFDKNVAEARAALAGASNEDLMENWSLLRAGQTIFSMPRAAVWRSVVMNHIIHHRGQLSVYLRLNDIPVPALYGPSADEGTF